LSSPTTLSRRAFLGFLRKKEEPAPPPRPVAAPAPAPGGGFSLEAFYSARARSGEMTGSQLPGPVRVRPQLCLAWQGSFCSTCSERCPVEDAIVIEAGRPRVVAERCNGCGLCVQVCPAPINALELLPSRSPQVPAP
jgi:Pyruvate/2-oxoacid:ferredoxin oxidoreductase delta subunit